MNIQQANNPLMRLRRKYQAQDDRFQTAMRRAVMFGRETPPTDVPSGKRQPLRVAAVDPTWVPGASNLE